ncbi:hypothetical protein D3C72_372420 [compost metagenome]
MEYFVIHGMVFGFLTAMVASAKNYKMLNWAALGFFFGVIAFGIICFKPKLTPENAPPSPKTHVKCPDCRELVLNEAKVCKHCGCKLIPQ